MSTEVQNIIMKRLDEINEAVKKVDEDVDELRVEIIHLQHEAKITKWLFAGAGGIVAIAVKDVILPLISKLMGG